MDILSNEIYHQKKPVGIVMSKRRLPFDTNSARMSSSTTLKRTISNVPRYKKSNRFDLYPDKSSSSSIEADEYDTEVRTLDETIPDNGLIESEKNRNLTSSNSHSLSMNNSNNKRDIDGPMIQELLQSNMDLKNEIRDIRRQIKHNHSTYRQRLDRSLVSTSVSNKNKAYDNANCSFLPTEKKYYDDSSTMISKLQKYKTEASFYKQQLDTCQDTISNLRKTIDSMEKRIEQMRTVEHHHIPNGSNQNEFFSTNSNSNTDHRFIHELFHLCIKYTPRSSRLKATAPSHNDMKTFIRQTFTDLIKSSSTSKISANKNNEINHFVCKCSDRIHSDHRPSHQYSLSIIEQCQSLFDITCFMQLPAALNELYYRYGELVNFKRSIASTLGVTESPKSVSCPKLIKTLQQTLDDAKSNELLTFKKLAKINDMNEAISKIRSYDDFVPYYHQFIEQMANLLEVSKGDEIMPAIKTLKLLAHNDGHRSNSEINTKSIQSSSLMRASSLISHKAYPEQPLAHSKSLHFISSNSNFEQSNELSTDRQQDDTEQQQTVTEDGYT